MYFDYFKILIVKTRVFVTFIYNLMSHKIIVCNVMFVKLQLVFIISLKLHRYMKHHKLYYIGCPGGEVDVVVQVLSVSYSHSVIDINLLYR